MENVTICKDREADYFVIESLPDNDAGITIADMRAMGMEYSILFHKDGTVQAQMFGQQVTGTWKENALTIIQDGETSTLAFILQGDLLNVETPEGPTVFRRSSDAPPDLNAEREPDSGKTFEASFEDLHNKKWQMSAACPDGWYHCLMPFFDNTLVFAADPDYLQDEEVVNIRFMGYAKMGLEHSATLEGDPVSYTANGRTWKGAYNRESTEAELFTIIAGEKEGEDLIVDVKSKGVEPGGELFQQILSGFKISGD